MSGWVKFGWYQLGNYPMIDVCEFDATKNYVLTHDWCAWVVEPVNEFLKKAPWYNEAVVQNLQHDVSWNLLWA